jgi:hypothetical protein
VPVEENRRPLGASDESLERKWSTAGSSSRTAGAGRRDTRVGDLLAAGRGRDSDRGVVGLVPNAARQREGELVVLRSALDLTLELVDSRNQIGNCVSEHVW